MVVGRRQGGFARAARSDRRAGGRLRRVLRGLRSTAVTCLISRPATRPRSTAATTTTATTGSMTRGNDTHSQWSLPCLAGCETRSSRRRAPNAAQLGSPTAAALSSSRAPDACAPPNPLTTTTPHRPFDDVSKDPPPLSLAWPLPPLPTHPLSSGLRQQSSQDQASSRRSPASASRTDRPARRSTALPAPGQRPRRTPNPSLARVASHRGPLQAVVRPPEPAQVCSCPSTRPLLATGQLPDALASPPRTSSSPLLPLARCPPSRATTRRPRSRPTTRPGRSCSPKSSGPAALASSTRRASPPPALSSRACARCRSGSLLAVGGIGRREGALGRARGSAAGCFSGGRLSALRGRRSSSPRQSDGGSSARASARTHRSPPSLALAAAGALLRVSMSKGLTRSRLSSAPCSHMQDQRRDRPGRRHQADRCARVPSPTSRPLLRESDSPSLAPSSRNVDLEDSDDDISEIQAEIAHLANCDSD